MKAKRFLSALLTLCILFTATLSQSCVSAEGEVLKDVYMDKTVYTEGDIITINTINWVASDKDFIRIFNKVAFNGNHNDYVADTSGNWGKSSYTVSTEGWDPGEYQLKAFENSGWTVIKEIDFTVKADKKVSMDKTSYTAEDTITVTTQNWSSSVKEYIRIYKTPVTEYDSGVLADTHSTVWGKNEYKFYPTNWESGEYQLIAFDGGSGWNVINKINFTITEPERGAYTVSGDTLTFNKETAIEFSKVKPEEKEGKLFIGWTGSDGEPANSNIAYTAGTVLTAKYIDFNAEDAVDFKIVDTSLRSDFSTGLRFTVEQSNALYSALPNAGEYGIAVLPSVILNENGWAELTLDGEYTYNDNSFSTMAVKADRIYETESDRIRYTALIKGIDGEKLLRQYTVRGYIKYTDLNGVSRVLYTDYASANPYAVAKTELEKTDISADLKALCSEIVNYVKACYSNKYDGLEKLTVTGSADNLNGYIYQLGQNGLYVRDVVINAGLAEDVEIIQLSDLHFNYINAKDKEERNPTVMSTADMRDLGRNASTVSQARAAVDFARKSDAVVVTGDIFDYLSWGGIELMYKEVWDIIPDTLMSVGNHEYLQKMLGVHNETLSADERWGILDKVWKHDVNYASKIVGGKVMLIQLNNGEGKFYEEQIAPLTADIALAREKGYTVLLFMHQTLNTGNPAEASVAPIGRNDTGNINFYTGEIGNSSADSATLSVCGLIKSSADVIKGVFNGHMHSDYYTEIIAADKNGNSAVIPQYTSTGGFYETGHVIKITVTD